MQQARSPDSRFHKLQPPSRSHAPVAILLCSQRLQLRGSGGFAPRFPNNLLVTVTVVGSGLLHFPDEILRQTPFNVSTLETAPAWWCLAPDEIRPARRDHSTGGFPVRLVLTTDKNAFQLSHRSWIKPRLASGRSPDSRFCKFEQPSQKHSLPVAGFPLCSILSAHSYGVVADLHRASRTTCWLWFW